LDLTACIIIRICASACIRFDCPCVNSNTPVIAYEARLAPRNPILRSC